MFRPLLAATVDFNLLKFPVLVSPKYDGIRCIILNGNPVTRSLKSIPNKYITSCLEGNDFNGLDGEIIVHTDNNNFQNTVSGVMSIEGKPNFTFFVFDNINLLRYPFNIRLEKITHDYPTYIQVVKHKYIFSLEELLKYEEEQLNCGFEGIMLRSPEGIYKFGRSTIKEGILLKMKRFCEEEATVVGVEEKMHNNNEAIINERGYIERSHNQQNLIPTNTLGSLIVLSKKWGYFHIGSGFSDILRKEVWDNKKTYINKQVTFTFQSIGTKDKPRIPIFKGFREDK